MSKAKEIPAELNMCEGELVTFADAEQDGDKTVRPFTMKAYTGKPVRTFFGPMVVDLAGMTIGKAQKPVLLEHDPRQIVGYSQKIVIENGEMLVEGKVIVGMSAAAEIITAADSGFPWEASMGFAIDKVLEIEEGETETVNGHEFKGPGMIVKKSRLKENSFTPMGADSEATSTVLAATDSGLVKVETAKEQDMPKKGTGDEPSTLSADEVTKAVESGVQAAQAKSDVRLKALTDAFPGRPDFVLSEFAAGHDVPAAKAALADVLVKEQEDGTVKLAALQKENLALKAKVGELEGGHPGVPVTPEGTGDGTTITFKAGQDPYQVADSAWDNDTDGCKKRFGDGDAGFNGWLAYCKNEIRLLNRREEAKQASA